MNYQLNAYAIQDIGQRTNQEDSFYPPFIDPCHYDETDRKWVYYDGTPHTDDRLFIVCDGMGGHGRGEVASRVVTQTMSKNLLKMASIEGAFNDDMVRHAVDQASHDLDALDDPNETLKMGTTMAMLKFHAKGATVAHIGDSRVYQFRPAQKGKPASMLFHTQDHTVVNDLVQRGQMSVVQAMNSNKKHILSRSMMANQQERPEVEIHHITDIQPSDVFLLCTDGIYEHLTDDQLCALLTDPNDNDVQRIQVILHQTLNNRDNHSAIIIRVVDVLNAPGMKSSGIALPPGSVLKSDKYTYHVEKVLGQGAFGITYLVNTSIAMQGELGTIHTGVKVALKEFCMAKEMHREGAEFSEIAPDSHVKKYADKFRREASKLASLSHPNILRVLEVFEANNTIYYSMEYLPDGTLKDYVNSRGGLPEQEALGYIRQVGSALLYMHTNKMLHLDIKPANIMRSVANDTVKIIDFGLSKRFEVNGDPESGAYLGFGTPGYAPLEQTDANVEHDFSPSLDVYALGATYYKLLTALTPGTAIDVLNRGLNVVPLVKKKVSQQSIDAIKAAMQPLKVNRLQSVQAFLDMLPRVDDQTVFHDNNDTTKKRWIYALMCLSLALAALCLYLSKRPEPLANDNDNASLSSLHHSTFDIQMVRVPGGTFLMGCADAEAEEDEQPLRTVTVSSFSIAQYEVTQGLWNAVMEDTDIKRGKNSDFPVYDATWDDVQKFLKRLNKKTGHHFRLPTEAEWEYAARCGGQEASTLPDADEAWYAESSDGHLHPVGRLQANALGLYDMAGNVWEMCSDWYDAYTGDSLSNPLGPKKGDYHILRGGSWNSPASSCRPTYRQDTSMPGLPPSIGLRLVEDVKQ